MSGNFGKMLREIRKSRDMTLEEMAELLGTTKQALSRYERGERTPKITIAGQFAEKLGVDLNILIDENGTTLDICDEYHQSLDDFKNYHQSRTKESSVISEALDKMPKEKREQAIKILQITLPEYADLFADKE